MTRRPAPRRLSLESLEQRSLMTSGLAGILSQQARLEAALAAVRGSGVHASEVGAASVSATPRQIQHQLKKLHNQQMQAQGKILSAVSLGNTTILIKFKQKLSRPLNDTSIYQIPGLDVIKATPGANGRSVILTTSSQSATSYALTIAAGTSGRGGNLRAMSLGSGGLVSVKALPTVGTIIFTGTPPVLSPSSSDLPRIVSAVSISNTEVVVQFNEPISERALNPAYYEITPANVNTESGRVLVKGARFQEYVNGTTKLLNLSTVVLTTSSQNEIDYIVHVANIVDVAGNPLAPPAIVGGLRIDPTVAAFQGSPPNALKDGVATLVDTDGDGLPDNVEQKGWQVTVISVDGTVSTRTVTSDINLADTDQDGLGDAQEANLRFDPRVTDTDQDGLSDFIEFNETFSNGLAQDTDGDGLDDNVEFNFFKTSPIFADSDGDQTKDGDEINSGRNALVSDLPRPEITVGGINLQLDVRFAESNAKESRDLETRSITASLQQSDSQSLSRQYTANFEAKTSASLTQSAELEFGTDRSGFKQSTKASVGNEVTAGFTFQQSEESASETQRSYEDSLSTEQEVTSGFTVDRQVVGAVMQVTVDLRNVSNLAYRVKNLQVTAFILDPQDRTRLTPVATLLPDSEPEEGFTLGPFVANRGPLIFSNTTIVPSLVESLMANASGLVFRVSNYDIINEDGRNFAFVSQDVVERTAQVVIDFGGARSLRATVGGDPVDENQPGDETEIHRVSTGAGRQIDTSGDGKITAVDRRVTFDSVGKPVGVTLYDALGAIGLTRYEARLNTATGKYVEYVPGGTTPVTLSEDQKLSSYSTFVETGREKVYRIRKIANDSIIKKYWEILTTQGIDQVKGLNDLILKSDSPVSLNFVQDLDGDGIPADVEYLLRTSDSPAPAGLMPASTDFTTNESVTFAINPGYITGVPVRVLATGSGLTAGTDYYIRNINGNLSNLGPATYSFYDTLANSQAGTTTGLILLNGPVTAGIVSVNTPNAVGGTFVDEATMPQTMDFSRRILPVGTRVQVTGTGGGLTAGITYYIRPTTGFLAGPAVRYSFYNSQANAIAGTATGRIPITTGIKAVFDATAVGKDTDRDTLDDRFEALIGWSVSTPLRTYQVYSSPNRADSNFDSPLPGVDSDKDGKEDRTEYDGSDRFAAPAGWTDANKNGLRDQFETFQVNASDFVLDPIRKDTDQDGIPDATEMIGFQITRVEDGTTRPIARTNPNSPFTDSDTFTDGFEKAVGLDPTDGTDTDVDGDGLPDKVENLGWKINVVGVSTTALGQGAVVPKTVKSRTDSDDSDGDGLTDYAEFFLKTDPSSKDSDGDGIDDRTEYLGYKLGHKVGESDLGIIKTNPLDADNDNDMRSDGDEAELVDIESKRWVVRVTGAGTAGGGSTAYRVFSNPLVADADFDGLVDGEEFSGLATANTKYRTDPNNANTDADKRDDGVEVRGGLNPLLDDFRVTVVADWVETFNDGTEESINGRGYGRYQFLLGVKLPSPTGVAGLSATPTLVMDNAQQAFLVDDQGDAAAGGVDDRYSFGYRYGSGAASFPAQSLDARSLVFSVSSGQRFSVELGVREFDGAIPTTPTLGKYRQVDVGGLGGNPVYKKYKPVPGGLGEFSEETSTVFSANDALALKQSVQDLYFFWDSDTQATQLVNSYSGGRLRGLLHVYLVID